MIHISLVTSMSTKKPKITTLKIWSVAIMELENKNNSMCFDIDEEDLKAWMLDDEVNPVYDLMAGLAKTWETKSLDLRITIQ